VQLLGPIAGVTAVSSLARPVRTIGSGPRAGQRFDVTVPTHVSAIYRFEGGQSAQSVFSFDSALKRRLVEVTGVDGTLVVPDPNTFTGEVALHRADGADGEPETVPAVEAGTTRGTGVVELARAIRAGRPERASGELGFHVLDVMIATIEAAGRGATVDVASTVRLAPALPAGCRERTL
jgi:predicted dehydrogenase